MPERFFNCKIYGNFAVVSFGTFLLAYSGLYLQCNISLQIYFSSVGEV